VSIGDWFRRLFSAPPGDDAGSESLDEQRIESGGGGAIRGLAGIEADEVAEGEVASEEPPPDPTS
jgi:hypothetical protein